MLTFRTAPSELEYQCALDELSAEMPNTNCHKHKKLRHILVQLTLEHI